MEHDEALGRILIAAAEPQGLERLMAGDTADAAAIAGHLAGCATCTAELARLRRTAAIARDVIRTQPDPALRERTLAHVRTFGVPRGATLAAAPAVGADEVAGPVAGAVSSRGARMEPDAGEDRATVAPLAPAADRRESRGLRRAILGLAAALVVAVGAGTLAYASLSAQSGETIDDQAHQIEVLEATTRATLAVSAAPDAQRVDLTATPAGGTAAGTLLFSPSSGELVAVASDLEPEAEGMEYGCWIEVDGTRSRIGKMYWAGDLWAWAGPVEGLGDLPPGAVFGVSLSPVGGGGEAAPVLTGEL